jgi:hypothetical protein
VRLLQFKWILIAAIWAANVEKAEGAVPDAPLSLGYPNAGKLVGGRRFRETPFMVMVPDHANSRVRWALPALISVLDRASRIIARKFPGSVLEIGELSRRNGGPIASHLSHQNGRDADVGFYQVDLDGQPVRAPRYVRFEGSGDSRDDPTVRFDFKRNWAFVRAILEDPHYEVRQIFIYAPLRARLLAYAAKVGAPHELRAKAAQAMMQPANALPHDDHFHVRISCPLDQIDQGCTDLPLWRSPGSPDEFGPDLLADAPRSPVGPETAEPLSPYAWGRMSKLWSVEQGICHKVDMACSDVDAEAACEDLGNLGLPSPPLPPDDTGAPGEPSRDIAVVTTRERPSNDARRAAPTVVAAAAAVAAGAPPSDSGAEIESDAPLCAARAAAARQPARAGDAPYCAPADEPNSCERPVTALVHQTEAMRRVDPNFLE